MGRAVWGPPAEGSEPFRGKKKERRRFRGGMGMGLRMGRVWGRNAAQN